MDKLTKEALDLIESSDKLLKREFIYLGLERAKEVLRERAEVNPVGVIELITGDSDVK